QLTGTGVHSGAPVSLTLHPAEADTGLRFLVTKRGKVISEIAAHVANVKNLTLCTVIGDDAGATVGTVEHLLAALRGLSIDNLYIEIDSKEVPIMDGSSAVFVDAIDRVGIRELSEPRKYIKVLKPVRVEENGCWGTLEPHAGFRMDVEIDFQSPVIGRQRLQYEMSPGVFRHELSRARTFGFMSDVEKLWKAGLALGADLTNTVAIGDGKVMNKEGLRYPQEFVRHKMLDAVGDLALAGMPLLGAYRSYRGGHRLNSMVLQALFADASNWEIAQAPRARATRSPVHVVPQTVVAAE
ncbi:UDP-3-O-acyl-N-acetylglucosamine deacetylase, partial [Hyphomicrobium sp.]|uniref:UDP-3-O-acyl-N-acetylglucosamine deacetylase n=1 Tax=Hyphomicrobium sp. TaxID=82 RepID=UPI000FB46DD8